MFSYQEIMYNIRIGSKRCAIIMAYVFSLANCLYFLSIYTQNAFHTTWPYCNILLPKGPVLLHNMFQYYGKGPPHVPITLLYVPLSQPAFKPKFGTGYQSLQNMCYLLVLFTPNNLLQWHLCWQFILFLLLFSGNTELV